jgi:cyclopropane fatty-acyl-phospholipid synthase-like methyltransferase
MTSDEMERFRQRYAISGDEALLAVEMEALGSDFRANGYTTRAQADTVASDLRLGPGRLLLDIGAGCGWPGVYLAAASGCAVISLDPVAQGLAVGRARSMAEGLAERSSGVRATAQDIPLRARSVDAVVHADLLC